MLTLRSALPCAGDADQAATISAAGGDLTALQRALAQALHRTEIETLKASARGESHDLLGPALYAKLIRAALSHTRWPRILPDFAQVCGRREAVEPTRFAPEPA